MVIMLCCNSWKVQFSSIVQFANWTMNAPPGRSITHSNPTRFHEKQKPRRMAELLLLADRVGFEPTSLLRDYLISSQGRYDHFDTCPY